MLPPKKPIAPVALTQVASTLEVEASIKEGGDTLSKWQTVNAVLVHATLRILPQVGYTSDGAGLQAYSDGFAECLRDGRMSDTMVRAVLSPIFKEKGEPSDPAMYPSTPPQMKTATPTSATAPKTSNTTTAHATPDGCWPHQAATRRPTPGL